MTLLLTRSDLAAILDVGGTIAALRAGFTADAEQPVAAQPVARQPVAPAQRVRSDLPGPGTATVLFPGLLPGVPAYTVKVNAKFPAAVPALRGVICLHGLADGTLLAIADSATLTAWRTGLAAALATDRLAAAGARTLGVIGAGTQAEHTLAGLRYLRPIRRVVVFDTDPQRASAFIRRCRDSGLDAAPAPSPAEVAAGSDIILLATWSRDVLLDRAEVRPGQHLTSPRRRRAGETGARPAAPARRDAHRRRPAHSLRRGSTGQRRPHRRGHRRHPEPGTARRAPRPAARPGHHRLRPRRLALAGPRRHLEHLPSRTGTGRRVQHRPARVTRRASGRLADHGDLDCRP